MCCINLRWHILLECGHPWIGLYVTAPKKLTLYYYYYQFVSPQDSFYASTCYQPPPEAFCFWSVRLSSYACMRVLMKKFANAISYSLLVKISPNLQVRCSWGWRWTDWILRSKGQRSRSQWDHVWSSKHLGRHFLSRLWNTWTYFNETYYTYHF